MFQASARSVCALIVGCLIGFGDLSAADLGPDERRALDAFDQELGAHASAVRSGKAAAAAANFDRLRQAARDRRVVMRRLVRENPEQAVAVALDRVRRKDVPADIQGELEQEISTLGSLEVRISRPQDSTHRPQVRREAVINGTRYSVSTWGAGLSDPSSVRRSLHGIAIDGVLALLPGRLRVLKPGEQPLSGKRLEDQRCPVSKKLAGANQEPSDGLDDVIVESGDAVHVLCQGGHIAQLGDELAVAESGSTKLASSWTMGPKKVLYIIARCSDEAGFPQTVANANTMMTTVADFYNAASWGQTTMTWEVIEVVLPKTAATYSGDANGDDAILSDARAAAVALDPKYALANWHFDAVRHSSLFGGWAGQGYVGGKGTWLQSSSSGVAVHELGHNYGLWHANFWNTNETSVIGAGTNAEYGDPYSEMGGDGQFSAYEKWRLDWIATTNVQTITASGSYRVYASDQSTAPSGSSMFGLRITKDSQRDYWISHRRQFANNWNLNGVHLHWDPWAITGIGESNGGAHLLDTTPGSVKGKTDAALVCGRTFSDTSSNIHITPMTVNTGTTPISVDVVVNIGSFPGNRKPTVAVTASATSVGTGVAVTFTATASDPDGDSLAVYWDFADDGFASNTLSTSHSWSTAKEYPVRVTVSDKKGGTATATIVVTVGTVSTFRISGTVKDSGGTGVEGVRVHRGTTASSVWTNSDGTYALVNVAAGDSTVAAQRDGFTFTPGFTNPVTVGPSATGKDFTQSNGAPTVATAAAASPATVTNKTSTLTVLGADDGGEASLKYSWAANGSVPASVGFSVNGTNAAKSTVATFSKIGSYPLRVTITDLNGLTVTSDVTVTVNQTATTVTVTPATPVVHVGATQAFSASAVDQFGAAMSPSPSFTWSVTGGKSINSSGVVAASNTVGGPYTVTATTNGRGGSTTFTVVNDAPTISAIGNQVISKDSASGAIGFTVADTETAAGSLVLSKSSSDTAVIPTSGIVFGGSGGSRTVTITPTTGTTGTVTVTVSVADAQGLTTPRAFTVYVGVTPPSGGKSGGGGGGGGGCGLGAGVSAFLGFFALVIHRLVPRRRRSLEVQ
jgi:hypothetical protein